MRFVRSELAFDAGLFANRSRHASKRRWVDGNLVRFRDGVPAQVGGWLNLAPGGAIISGLPRSMIAWRPLNQNGKYAAIGTPNGAYLYDGDLFFNITPDGFVAGEGSSILGRGFGSDRFGVGTFGTERESTGNLIDASSWVFDMFGEQLLGCFTRDGALYEFNAVDDAKMRVVDGAPTARAIAVSDERHVFAFGADGNPGLVRWCDRENYRVWDAAATNRAGGYELQVRSPFQAGRRVRGRMLGWTRTEVFSFEPLQNAFVYSRDRISTEAGVVGPHAVAVVTDSQSEAAYWMGPTNFYAFDGFVRTLDCELRDYVFTDVNLLQGAKFQASVNSAFDEIWFFYCSAASEEIDRGVIFNFVTGAWSKATIARLCWIDTGVFTAPLAFGVDGKLYSHETGSTADGAVMPSFVLSHPIQIGVGEQLADVDQFWLDLQDGGGSVDVSFLLRNRIGEAAASVGPFTVAVGDEFLPLAFSAREFQLRIAGKTGAWELGVPQISMRGGSLR